MGFNHIKKNYSGKTGVVFKIAGKIPLPPGFFFCWITFSLLQTAWSAVQSPCGEGIPSCGEN